MNPVQVQPMPGSPRDRYAGAFGKIILPAIILQSVLIGGGYATGREIVEYGAKYGPRGWLAVVAIFVSFTIVSILTFEVARTFKAYDYKSFIRQLIGKLWPLFDVLFGLMAVLIIAVMTSAASTIMADTLGVPGLPATVLIILAVGALTYAGATAIETFKSVGTTLLYVTYAIFGIVVLASNWGGVHAAFATMPQPRSGEVGIGEVLGSGVLYAGYNLAIYPAVLFVLHRQTERRETVISGVLSGILMTLPFALTFLCLMAFFPDPRVMDAPVPWLPMLRSTGGGWLIIVFGIVMGWTLLETSVGLIHSILDRVDEDLRSRGSARLPDGLSQMQKGVLGAGILVGAALLSRIGIIELVARGYTLMGYLFILLFALPLVTVGLTRIGGLSWLKGGERS